MLDADLARHTARRVAHRPNRPMPMLAHLTLLISPNTTNRKANRLSHG
jgi:hypothetical protein